jgi:hypothetical protein
MPAESLGQYASLSFVVIDRKRNWGFRDFGLRISDLEKRYLFRLPFTDYPFANEILFTKNR